MYAPATQVEPCRVLRDGLFDLEVRPPPCRAVQCLHTVKNCLVQPFAVWALIIGTVGQHPPLFAMDPCGESMVVNLIQLGAPKANGDVVNICAHSNLLKIYRQSA